MSTEQTPVESVEDDLDIFSAEFFGQNEVEPEPASLEDDSSKYKDRDAKAKDTQNIEDDADLADEDDDSDEGDGDGDEVDEAPTEPEPKPKKNRLQERINEVIAREKEAERKAARLEAELEAIKSQLNPKTEKTTSTTKVVDTNRPNPDATNDDGSAKYPLGEFNPQYQADLVNYLFEQKEKEAEAKSAQKTEEAKITAQREALESGWQEKLGPAQERYPDFMEKGQELVDSFDGIDQSYGEYLTATIMGMEYGPDVLYYLANNPDEAKKIVNSGATKATVALGRLEAKFADAEQEKQKARPKISQAPTPPAHRTKGSAAAVIDVPDDTDDLDSFSKKFFKK